MTGLHFEVRVIRGMVTTNKNKMFILLSMLNCPLCDIKPGTKDSKFCRHHLLAIAGFPNDYN